MPFPPAGAYGKRRFIKAAAVLIGILLIGLAWKTWRDLVPLPKTLSLSETAVRKMQFLDRDRQALTVTWENQWNLYSVAPLYEIPLFLQQAFIAAEDQRFYRHHGADWRAWLAAICQNVLALRAVRGASTISEQVVRMLHPRPRTIWTRWLESIEARRLEQHFNKAQVLEFYLNQVPFARKRRGVVQAAELYFNRDLDTLSRKEMLTLAVSVRAPSRFDFLATGHPNERSQHALSNVVRRLQGTGALSSSEADTLLAEEISVGSGRSPVDASHFIRYVVAKQPVSRGGPVVTSLDGVLQRRASELLQSRLKFLKERNVNNGAVLAVENSSRQILAWVNAANSSGADDTSQIDAITTPRQPGSTLKPFLYALALERGWNPATIIDDSALAHPVGTGLHRFRNYSRQNYGPLRLRLALGNSLNIPAVKTIAFVGKENFLERLRALDFTSLNKPADFYGDGLALGNGELTLLELVQAYTTLAHQGVFAQLRFSTENSTEALEETQIFSPAVSSLIADILSDPSARRLEFGTGNLMRFPVQTAVKTGTSNDYHDAWAVGYSSNYTVGVWMGNLNRSPMREVSGSIGPALVLRAIFAELNRTSNAQPFFIDSRLVRRKICAVTGQLAAAGCPSMLEWFDTGNTPTQSCTLHGRDNLLSPPDNTARGPKIVMPTPGLQLAMDPRIPDRFEACPFKLDSTEGLSRIDWLVDGQLVASRSSTQMDYTWQLLRGHHYVQARVWPNSSGNPLETPAVGFLVK